MFSIGWGRVSEASGLAELGLTRVSPKLLANVFGNKELLQPLSRRLPGLGVNDEHPFSKN